MPDYTNPAFPCRMPNSTNHLITDFSGMTLRQYVAIHIASGLASDPMWDTYRPGELANRAVAIADALIEAMNK